MKRAVVFFCLLLFCPGVLGAENKVLFNPPLPGDEKVVWYIVAALDKAQNEVLVQQFQFTEPNIITAIQRAKERGCVVIGIFDKVNKSLKPPGDGVRKLKAVDVPVSFDPIHIAHNKVLIIDKKLVICGSFNLTTSANQRNCENCLFIDEPQLVKRFLDNFQNRLTAARKREEAGQ
jgi:phospholipase D